MSWPNVRLDIALICRSNGRGRAPILVLRVRHDGQVNTLSTLGFAMGSAWLSGINLYATVLALGLLQRFHLVRLPGDLSRISDTWILAIAGAMYLVQFVADKIPAIDSTWDAIHTFIRIPAGAVLAASAFAHFDPGIRIAALIIGGGVALGSHGTKATVRLAANTSPEPFSNIALSLAEDALTFGSTLLMAFHPVIILGVVIVFVTLAAWLVPKIVRALGRMFRKPSKVPRPATA
jgi:hypothetical protein